ncbi:MAG: hypothetical protein V2B14_06110 [bacterium]
MDIINNILIISDKEDDLLTFRSKLENLSNINFDFSNNRNLNINSISDLTLNITADSIIGATVDKAVELCRKYIPDTVIIFIYGKDEGIFEICKVIRMDSILKDISIIFIFQSFDEELIMLSLIADINDYIILPANDSEILIRIVWCLKKSEVARQLEKKEILLKDLGIIDKVIGAYTSNFISKVFTNEINIAGKYKYPLVMMIISLDTRYQNNINDNYLAGVIKKSIRNNDIFGIAENNKFYLILPRTNLNGSSVLYNRFKENIEGQFSISVGVSELSDETDFESLALLALKALNEAMSSDGNKMIVYEKSMQEKPEEPKKEHLKVQKSWLHKVQNDKKNYDVFKQKFNRRISSVVSPVFRKMQENIYKEYSSSVIVDQFSNDTDCYFSIREIFEGKEVTLKIIEPGIPKISIEITYIKLKNHINKRFDIELEDLTERNITRILQNLFEEFKKIVNLKK